MKLVTSILALLLVVLGMVVGMVAGFGWAAATVAVTALVAAPAVVPYRERTVYAYWARRRAWRRHERRGRNLYRAGIAGVTPTGSRQLPGLLARVATWEATDAAGRDYALVQYRSARQWAVVLQVAAQGGALVDSDTSDVWTAGWGEYLAMLGDEGGVVQAAAVVETTPSAGDKLRMHVQSQVQPQAPVFAQDVAAAAAAELPVGVSDVTGYVALTFSERGLGVERSGSEDATAAAVAGEIGRRLPGLSMALRQAGASEGLPLTVAGLSRRVRECFDPAAAAAFSSLDADGLPVPVSWEDAGPSAHDESAEAYAHDSGLSRTWEALKVPAGAVRDTLLSRLTGPMNAAPRKRVTLLYRPVDSSRTADVVDQDLKAAINRAGRRQLEHAHDSADLRSARQATQEEADGAGVVTFSMLVTVTVTDPSQFDRACSSIERAARGAKFRLSPVRGAQAAAFAGALGLGMSLQDLSVIPHALRQHV